MTDQEKAAWEAGYRPEPVWRDGISTTLSYVIVAVHKRSAVYNCVCIRPMGGGSFKVKFYPDLDTWRVEDADLRQLGFSQSYDRRHSHGYIRYYADVGGVQKLLHRLSTTRNVSCVNFDQFKVAVDQRMGTNTSRNVHPSTAYVPTRIQQAA